MPRASTWKQRLPSSSQSVAVTRGFMPGGGCWPVVSKPLYWAPMFCCTATPGRGRTFCVWLMGFETDDAVGGDVKPLA